MYPNLFDLILLLLCVPSTSVPCKRTFSKAGYTIFERRNILTAKTRKFLYFCPYYQFRANSGDRVPTVVPRGKMKHGR